MKSRILVDAYNLTTTVGINAALGFLYWVFAARLHSPATVGLAAAIISAAQLMASIGLANLPATVMRFLPVAGSRGRVSVLRAYALGAGLSAVLACGFLLGPTLHLYSEPATSVSGSFLAAIAFVLAVCTWSVFFLQDSVLLACGGSKVLPVENGLYGSAKLLLLIVLAGQDVAGIVVSWFLPAAVATVPISRYIFRRLRRSDHEASGGPAFTLRFVRRFMFVGLVPYSANIVVTTAMPLLVASMVDRRQTAFFTAAWSLGLISELLLIGFPASLVVAGSRSPGRVRAQCREMLKHYVPLIVLAAAGLGLVGPIALRIYGSEYADAGANVLRLFAVGLLFRCFRATVGALAAVEGRIRLAAAADTAFAIVFVAASTVFINMTGIAGAGLAYLVANVISLAVVAPALLRPRLVPEAVDARSS